VLRRMFEAEKQDLAGERRKMLNEDPRNCTLYEMLLMSSN
jgi:hypothetical protein